ERRAVGGDDVGDNGTEKHSKLGGGAGADVLLGGSKADVIVGDAGNDWIEGRAGDDRLYGYSGSDHVFGGAGDDVLAAADDGYADSLDGGTGAATLIYRSQVIHGVVDFQRENVVDFTPGQDKVHIDGLGDFDYLP